GDNKTPAKLRSKPFAPESPDSLIADVDSLILPPGELRDRARYDRVVTWTKDKGLSVYSIGSNTALGTAAAIDRKPLGAVWIGPDLLVWTSGAVTLLKGDALAAGWTVPLRVLPSVEMVQGDASVVKADDSPPGPQNIREMVINGGVVILDNQAIRVGPGGRVFINNNGIAVAQPPAGGGGGGDAGAAGAEEIT